MGVEVGVGTNGNLNIKATVKCSSNLTLLYYPAGNHFANNCLSVTKLMMRT